MQHLLRYICENGFEHHVAANLSTTAGMVHEAASKYLGWPMYWHNRLLDLAAMNADHAIA